MSQPQKLLFSVIRAVPITLRRGDNQVRVRRRLDWAGVLLTIFWLGKLELGLSQNPDGFNPGTNSLAAVYAIALQPDGKILIAGYGFGDYLLGRFNFDGSQDTNFHSLDFGAVNSLAVQPDGKILVIGDRGGTWVGRLNSDGTTDGSFQPTYNGSRGAINSLALQADGKVLIGGNFFTYGQGLARLNQDGSEDTNFNASVLNAMYSCCAESLAIQANGQILVGGGFGSLDGESRWNLGRVNENGSLDRSFDPHVIGGVSSLVVQPDGKILVGGTFTNLAGQTRTNIGRLNQDGSLDTLFNPGANAGSFNNGSPGSVYCLALQADGKILVGGSFTSLAGQPCTNIGRLNPDGSLDATFQTWVSAWENTGGNVYSLALQSDGKVLVGGSFTNLGGQVRLNVGRVSNTETPAQTLVLEGSRISWWRGGAAPEVWRTTFETTTNGTNWVSLGVGSPIPGGWQLLAADVSPEAAIRARGFIAAPPSSWFVETVPPRLFGEGFRSGNFGFNIVGAIGQSLTVEGSINLRDWNPISSNKLSFPPLYFIDRDFTNFSHRYYRARVN